ncbi:hypothetical protein L1049_005361 [Liquidambar formosana]|uniref:UBC core domain-containing protein n=1 Tax=Liquidambar formosana TaxID=63359 RepID=A0AAP0X1E3_LIQFO
MDENNFKANQPKGEIEEIEDEVEKRFKLFKNFETTRYPPPDHHFINSKFSTKKFDFGSTFFDKNFDLRSTLPIRINEEWKTMETSLPDTIFVRAYESRIDLLRAVIVGPTNTPYSNGLFFFDILLPNSYPAQPPKLFYYSHGLDVNPSLYPNGKVCLNLLNTGDGHKEEKWNPRQSTILEVLVSVQGLILNAEPYLNEPGCILYHKESLKYNKDVFMLTCVAMLYTLEMPPNNFEDFVVGHFRTQAHPILMHCRSWRGITGFPNQLFLNLTKAFKENGTYCEHHVNQVKNKDDEESKQKSDTHGFGTKIWNKLKNMLEL